MQGTNEGEMDQAYLSFPVVPRSTLASIKKRISTNGGESNNDLVTTEDAYSYHKQTSLTTPEDRDFLAGTANYRDKANNGMSRKELIDMILTITGTVD